MYVNIERKSKNGLKPNLNRLFLNYKIFFLKGMLHFISGSNIVVEICRYGKIK